MISRIKNRSVRRAALVVAVPLLVPVQLAITAAAAAWEELRDWHALVLKVWRQ